MYEVIDSEYPRLETYLCYECGFHADSILMEQNSLYKLFQRLFLHSKNKDALRLKSYSISAEKLQVELVR